MAARKKRKKSSFWSTLVMAAYLLAALGLLLSYLSPFVNPSSFWPIAFFGLAYPFFLAVNLLFLLFWLLRGNTRFLLPLVLLLAGLSFHRQHFGFRFPSGGGRGDSTLQVMTYNSHSFSRYGKHFSEKTKSGMLSLIRQADPDIIAIQEFYTRPEGSFNIRDSLLNMLGTSHHFIEVVARNDFETRGMAIFSKYPIENREAVRFGGARSYNGCMYADIRVGSRMIRVLNLHLQSISFQPEDYQYLNQIKDKLDPDVHSSRRIGGRLKRAFIARADQAETVAALIRESPYPVIVLGDFNDTPMSYAYRTIRREGLQSAFAKKGSGYAITYGGAFPNFQIDHILADKEHFEILDYEIMKRKLSDHYPVCSELRIKQP